MWKLPFAMAKKGKDDADQGGSGDVDVVQMARGLAQIVTDHHLTELVIETNGTTVTVRREAAVTMAAPMQMQMPMHMPAPHLAVTNGAPAVAVVPIVDDKSHTVTSP